MNGRARKLTVPCRAACVEIAFCRSLWSLVVPFYDVIPKTWQETEISPYNVVFRVCHQTKSAHLNMEKILCKWYKTSDDNSDLTRINIHSMASMFLVRLMALLACM